MAGMTHDELRELTGGYALEALSDEERRAVDAHLPTCAACTREVADLRAVANALPYSVPQLELPPGLRERVLRAAVAEPRTIPFFSSPRPRAAVWPMWLSAAASIAAVALGLYALTLRQRVDRLEARLREANAQLEQGNQAVMAANLRADRTKEMMAILAAADVRPIQLAGQQTAPTAAGRAFWSPSRRALVFTAANLPPLSAGRQYQLWVIPAGGTPISAGMLDLDQNGRILALADSPNGDPGSVAVSEEPAGGVPQPTGPIVLAGAL